MTRPIITSQITLGNIITLAVMLVGMATSWAYMDSAVQGNGKAIVSLQNSGEKLEARTRVLELSSERQTTDFQNMARTLGKIEAQQDETNTLIRQIYTQLGTAQRN